MKDIFFFYALFAFALLQMHFKRINYNYHNYNDIMTIFNKLALSCPQYIKIDTAQHRYGLDSVKGCGSLESKCENLIVYMTDFDSYTVDRPQFYASGLVHGDEIIGPTTITEFVLYYCSQKPSHFALNLLKQKMLIFTPMTNAYGYYKRVREDIIFNEKNERIQVDPNRDFPYTKQKAAKETSTDCMKTITARTINEIFKEHIIQSALTFHGGTNVLGHAWGNFYHLDNNQHSTESPDHSAFRSFGQIMRKASSSTKNIAENIKDYVLGDMSKAVYPVDGGLEDWAYAGSWENDIEKSTSPIKTCKPSTFTSYNTSFIPPFQLRCIMFLVETADEKQPSKQSLGYFDNVINETNEIFNFTKIDFYGHIPRNMRLIFAGADLISANFFMNIASYIENDIMKYRLETMLMGCETVEVIEQHQLEFDHLNLIVLSLSDISNSTIIKSTKELPCYWRDIERNQQSSKLIYDIPSIALNNTKTYNPKAKGTITFYKGINPDLEWKIQTKPDPNIPPQSHVVKSKTDPVYNITNRNYSLKSNNKFYSYPFISFNNGFFIIVDDPEALLYPIQEDISFISYLIYNSNKKATISKSIVKFEPKTQLDSLQYASQIEYNISLIIPIGGEDFDSLSLGDLLLNHFTTKEPLIAKIALSNINDNQLILIDQNCYLFYTKNSRIEETNMIIKCNHLFASNTTNAFFIRNNIINSLFGLNWSIKGNKYQLRGIFSAGKLTKGKFIDSSLNSTDELVCNSHIIPNSTINIFEIQMKKISNYKFNITFSIQKSVLDNPLFTTYFVLIPYANEHLLFNLSETDAKEIELDKIESNGRIIGKTIYVFKTQSENELNMVQSALKNKKYSEMIRTIDSPLNSIQMNRCSITSNALFHNQVVLNTVISDQLSSKPISERINDYLLMGIVGINVIGLIIVLICLGIKLKKKLFKGYDKLETRTEMETIQIQDMRKKETNIV